MSRLRQRRVGRGFARGIHEADKEKGCEVRTEGIDQTLEKFGAMEGKNQARGIGDSSAG